MLEGRLDVLIQGVPLIRAEFGDIVFTHEERYHRATSAGIGMSTRLAVTPCPPSLHYEQPDRTGGE